ncbi:MAG: IS1595 family transposase [Bacillota bacterium]|nr:IS1595 family transposase [Bacillota bacterium]
MSDELNKTNEVFEAIKSLKPSQIKYLENVLLSPETAIPEGNQHESSHVEVLACPDCGSSSIVKFGRNRLGKQRHKCKNCKRSFVLPSKSPLRCSKKTVQQWLLYMECMAKGMSIRKSAVVVGINIKTSFYWRHKILNALKSEMKDNLSGVVEIDETGLPESFKGNRSKDANFHMGRPPRKRGVKLSETYTVRRVRVICCLDRDAGIFSQVIGRERPGIRQLISLFKDRIKTGSTICTNNNTAYNTTAKELDLNLYKLAFSSQVIEETYHNQKAKTFGRELKRFLVGFNGVATKYLNNYIAWLKWNCLRKVCNSGFSVMEMLLVIAFSSAWLRVCDLRNVSSMPEMACTQI